MGVRISDITHLLLPALNPACSSSINASAYGFSIKYYLINQMTETQHTQSGQKRDAATLLDNIYTNVKPNANSIESGVFKTDISDHYSIFCITDFVTMGTRKKEFRTKRDFRKKNISNFRKFLKKND